MCIHINCFNLFIILLLGYLVFTETGVTTGPKVDENTWGDLLKHYWALLLVVFLSALLVVLMPIIGYFKSTHNITVHI